MTEEKRVKNACEEFVEENAANIDFDDQSIFSLFRGFKRAFNLQRVFKHGLMLGFYGGLNWRDQNPRPEIDEVIKAVETVWFRTDEDLEIGVRRLYDALQVYKKRRGVK